MLGGACRETQRADASGVATLAPSSSSSAATPPLAAATTSAEAVPRTREYALSKRSDAYDGFILEKVAITERATVLTLSIKGGRGVNQMTIRAPGSKSAYFIKRTDGATRYPLLSVAGVPTEPTVVPLAPGVRREFTLTFERLDPDVKSFDVIGGDDDRARGRKSANFMNVTLDE
jgi:hypothetical protein